jgi:hypothetical protein
MTVTAYRTFSVPPRKSWSLRKALGLVVLLVVSGLLAVFAADYLSMLRMADATYRGAIGEADRLDPGWRLEEIEERHRKGVASWAEEASAVVLSVINLLPEGWPSTDAKVRERLGPYRSSDLFEAVSTVAPNVKLGRELAAALAEEMHELEAALSEAESLADLHRGRFPIEFADDFISTWVPDTQNSRKVVRLLQLSAVNRAQAGDCDGALVDCCAIVGVSRAIGDEPLSISQLVRIAEDSEAITMVERVMAQGEASDSALKRVQVRFAWETVVPFSLIGMRGDRAGIFRVFDKLADGTLTDGGSSGSGPTGAAEPARLPPHTVALFRYNQGLSLSLMTRAVEIAKLPMEEQEAPWREWEALATPGGRREEKLSRSMTDQFIAGFTTFHSAHRRIFGMLNVAQAMVAMERFRIANGRWPESLGEIPESMRSGALIDPYSGESVLTARGPDGWIVYCVGPDGRDDGGKLDPRFNPTLKGFDWGFRLWDVPQRRRPPEPEASQQSETVPDP